jgi:hypothetical protein
MLGRFATKIPIFLPPVVDKHTAGRYWLPAERIADTDHFSIVKPRDRSSAPYSFLRSVLNRFQHEIPAAAWPKEIPIALPSRPNQAWIGTPAFFNDLRARVTQFEDIALYGRARMGKTFLAQHLIWDDDLRARFADGVLWGAVTNTRDFGSILIEWGAGAGLKRDTLLALSRVQDRVRAVANVVSNRRMLLVLDNCTSLADAELFKVIGSNSTRVLTTQSPEIAKEFSRGHAVEIQELDDNSIRQLLSGAQSPLVGQSPEAVNFLKVLSSSTEKLLTAAQLLQTLSDTEAKQLFALRREEPSR